MSTTATLGFAIDSSPASSAAVDLEKLTASAVKTERSVESLEQAARGLGTALGAAGKGADGAKAPVDQLGKSFSSQDQHVQAFRMELERLTAKYQPLAQATRQYEASVGEINRAHQLGIISAQQMQKALDSERMAYDRLKQSAQSAGQAVQAANQNQGPSGAQRAAGVNAGYQFQDIAVTAAMGMSPLMIGLQQGTQLASVVGSMERPVAGLAAAFTSLISPVSLVTIGLTAGVAALIQYFTSADEGSEKFEQKFAKQAELIAAVAARWGDAYPALKAYSDQLQTTADQAELVAGQNAAVELRYKQMGEALNGLVSIAPQVSKSLRDITSPEGAQAAIAYEQAISDMRKALEGGKDPSEAFVRATQALSTIIEQSGSESLRKYGEQFDVLAGKMGEATRQAEQFRMQMPDLGTLQGPWSENGQLFFPEQFTPTNPGVPTSRPKIELEGMPGGGDQGAPTIVNSDGRLVSVPVPGQKPNYFEREEDLPKSFSGARANRNTYWSRDVLNEERDRMDAVDLAKGFMVDFKDTLISSGGDVGEALGKSLQNALMNSMSRAWDDVFNKLANSLVTAVIGPPSAGLMNKGIGFTGANTTLGQILGAGGGMAVNDNSTGGFNGLGKSSVTSMPLGDIGAYAKAIQSIESGGNYGALGPVTKNGDRAYGAYQVMGNNIGPWSEETLGRAVTAEEFLKNPSMQDQVFEKKFGGYVDKYGAAGASQAWFGGPGSVGKGGRTDVLGTSVSEYSDKFTKALDGASEKVGEFGGGLSKAGEALSTSFFPAAPAAPGQTGGGGGFGGWLGSIFGGGLSSAQIAKYTPMTGLFADGTNYAPGGMAVVGERGPELVNLPQGAQVFNTNKSAEMMKGSGGGKGGSQRPQLNVYVQGGSGDNHIRELARQGAQEAVYQYNEGQINGGFGDNQKKYTSRVG